MAAANKPTAVHFSLVAFVMISAICGFMWYMSAKDLHQKSADLENAKTAAKTADSAANTLMNEVALLKKVIGHTFDKTGLETEPDNAATTFGAATKELSTLSSEARASYTTALQKLHTELRDAKRERDDLATKLDKTREELLGVKAREDNKLAAEVAKVAAADAELQALIKKKDEIVDAKQKEVEAATARVNEMVNELDKERQARAKQVKELTGVIDSQVVLITKQNEELDGLKKTSFEIAKGTIRYVDHSGKMVWISLGRDDHLNLRTTFSVYEKSNQGMARDNADIKGAIEVERIIGPHLAQARVTKDDVFRPMTIGDPIYTPLWSPGGTEKFALVGKIDLNNDGYSDRDALLQTIHLAGAEVVAEVTEQGVRTGTLDQSIKFLVLGKIPKLDEAETKEQKDQFIKLAAELDVIRKQAKENGVRIISLADFSNYIGYVTHSNIYRQGDKFNGPMLDKGAHSTSAGANPGDRRSRGRVSDLYEKANQKGYKPPVSPGQTSKVFKGGR